MMLTFFLNYPTGKKGGKGYERHDFENRMRTGRERRKLPSGSRYNECRIVRSQ
jgi:hypothetical protein